MIEKGKFADGIKAICSLIGKNPSKEQVYAIWEKLKESDYRDFVSAINDDNFLLDAERGLSYPLLKRYIQKYQLLERVGETEKNKEEWKETTKRFYGGNIDTQEKGKQVLKNIRLRLQKKRSRDEFIAEAKRLGVWVEEKQKKIKRV